MGAVHTDVFTPHLPPAGTVGAETTHAHTDDVLLQVGDGKLAADKIAEEKVGVRGYLVALIVQTLALHNTTADIARGMKGKPPVADLPKAVPAANPVADNLGGALRIHEQTVSVKEVGARVTETDGNVRQCLR